MNTPKVAAKMLTLEVAVIALFVVPALGYAAFTVSKTATTNSPDSLQRGLVGHWTFDGPNMLQNVVDSSGSGNAGRLTGFTSTTSVQGAVGQALSFDGSDDYVEIGDVELSNSTITVAAWFKPTAAQYNPIVTKYNSNGNLRAYVLDKIAAGNFRLLVSDDGLIGAGSTVVATGASTLPIGQWTHVVGTFDGNGNVNVYVNGILDGTGADAGVTGIADVSRALRIANTNSSSEVYASGAIDDVRIYNRQLSADEVRRLYGLGATSHVAVSPATTGSASPTGTGLLAHWTFDGKNLLQNVADSAGSGYNGRMSGFTSTSSAIIEGKLGQALKFDGSDDFIDTVNFSSIITASFSVCSWVYWSSTTGTQKILHVQNGTPEVALDNYNGGSGNEKINFYTAAVGSSNNALGSGTDIRANRWYHICGTYDNAAKVKTLYVDGAQVATGGTTVQIAWPSSLLRIGRRLINTEPLNGKMDDVRVYSRSLSAQEVKQIYGIGATAHVGVTTQTGLAKDAGLIGHWTFDGPNLLQNATDSSGQGNAGRLLNTAATSTIVQEGKIGQAINLDGVDDYVAIGNASVLEVALPFSASMWIRPESTTVNQSVIQNDDWADVSGNYYGFVVQIATTVGVSYGDGGAASSASRRTKSSSGPLALNKWNHVVVIVRGATDMSVYVDGVEYSAGTGYSGTGGSIAYSANGMRIGSGQVDYDGTIDDVRMYNRALSADEVLRLYQNGL